LPRAFVGCGGSLRTLTLSRPCFISALRGGSREQSVSERRR
jgi:hypothetical protein